MTNNRDHIDNTLQRVALLALFFSPEISITDPKYNLAKDIDYCLAPLRGLTVDQRMELSVLLARVVVDPTRHRRELFEYLNDLAEPRE